MSWFMWKEGTFGFILWGLVFILKAPWSAKLFSERNGYVRWRQLGFGWRFHFGRLRR